MSPLPTAHGRFRSPVLCFRPLAVCLLAVLAPLAAQAEGPSPEAIAATDLDAVQVTAERPNSYLLPSTSTATRLDLTPRETPQSVSAVTREQMDDFGLTSLNDALDTTTGVSVESVETSRTYYTARGFDIVNFQRDGLGLPLPYGIQDGDVDTAIFERIEVLRGANGLMSSTGNPSATINFVRKRPVAGLQGDVRLTLGQWDRRRLDVDVSSPLNTSGSVRARGVAAYEQGDSYLDRYSLEKHVLYGVVEADLGPATTLAAGVEQQRNRPDSPLWGALPLYYTDGSQAEWDRSTSTASDWSHWDTRDTRAFVEFEHDFGDWSLRASLNHEKKISDTELFYVYGTPDRETGLGLFAYPSDYDGEYDAQFLDVYATGPMMLFGREHDVVIGGNRADGENSERSLFANVGDPLPPLDQWDGRFPKPVFDPDTLDPYFSASAYDYRRSSLYATVRWNIADAFKLITGASHSRARTDGFSYGEANSVEESRTTPFAGAVWDLSEHWSLYGSYGEIFNQQAEVDADNRLLGALTGDNAEIGAKGEWFDGRLNASFAVYRARQQNLAEYAGFNTDTGQSFYTGIDAESRGFEFDIAGQLSERWQLAGGFSSLQLEDAGGDDTRTYVPRRTLRLSTVYRLPWLEGFKVGAALDWQNAIHRETGIPGPDGASTRIRQDSYALLGLMARYDFAPGWNATLNLDNLTDEKYLTSLYWEQGYYGAPRNVSLTVGYRF
jgi:outer membrane receptor for ferric coprogen and ferric-rhodotorulic acid